MPQLIRARAALAALAVPLLSLACIAGCITMAGCNDCDFTGKRCSGNAVEQCGEVDQVIGRAVVRTACEGANPVCVAPSGESALCVVAADKRCTTGERRCDGNVLVRCVQGFEVALDCKEVRPGVPAPGQTTAAGQYSCTAPTAGSADCRPL